jgi:hypothetical protein
MKKVQILLAGLAGLAIIATGCVSTVSDTNTFATTWSQDMVSGRYQRSVDQVYQAAMSVVSTDGALVTEYIPHDNTNNVRSLEGRVNDKKIWMRVSEVQPSLTQIDVESRSKWGVSDVDLSHQLEKEVALKLMQSGQ